MENGKSFESSENVNELFTALSKAQGDMEPAIKDGENPFYSKSGKRAAYATLASCWDAIRVPFSKNNLSIIQIPEKGDFFSIEFQDEDDSGKFTRKIEGYTIKMVTVLAHSSGQWIKNTIEFRPVKTDPQGAGSAMTYARRYGLMAIAGVASDDDDANDASNIKQVKITKSNEDNKARKPLHNHAPGAINPPTKNENDFSIDNILKAFSIFEWTQSDIEDRLKKPMSKFNEKDRIILADLYRSLLNEKTATSVK